MAVKLCLAGRDSQNKSSNGLTDTDNPEASLSSTKLLTTQSVEVEKASTELGVIIFKCLAFHPDMPDAEGDIVDAASMEAAFYDFMARDEEAKVDLNHQKDIPGKIVAGWMFPEEYVYRVAFRPDDPNIVERAKEGDFTGTSFGGTADRIPIE